MQRHLRLVTGEPNRDTAASAVLTHDEAVDMCARHADALAGQAEHAANVVISLLDHIADGHPLAAQAAAVHLRSTLRVLACSLGELHAALDEIGHTRPGGAS